VTSTTVVGSTTTTTLPVEERLLSGVTLRLTDRPGKPRKRDLRIVSKDRELLDATELPLGEATLRVLAVGGDGFAATYSLPAEGWKPIAPKNPGRGLSYRSKDGPIRKIVLKTGKQLSIRGRGDGLVQTLGTEPERVQVELRLGARRHCLEFGGASDFRAEHRLERRNAPRPDACP
jgi:hypothetical protein